MLRTDISFTTTLLAFLVGLTAVYVFYFTRPREERRALLPIALVSFALKAILVPIVYWIWDQAGMDGFGGKDSFNYDLVAREMAWELANGSSRNSRGWEYQDPAYNIFGAVIYLGLGANTLAVRMLNVTVSTFTLVYAYRIGRLTFDERTARLGTMLLAAAPFGILLTVDHRKDPIAQFLATAALYHTLVLVYQQRGSLKSIPMVGMLLTGMYFVRGRFTLPFLGILATSFVISGRQVARSLVYLFVIGVAFVGLQMTFPEDSALSIQSGLDRFEANFELSARLGSSGGLLRFARMSSPAEIYKLPFAVVMFVIQPFPPHLETAIRTQTLAEWAQLFSLVLFPQFLVGIRDVFRSENWRRRSPLLIYAGAFLVLMAATNISVFRYRETVSPVLWLFTAAGMLKRQNPIWIAAVYFGFALMGGVVLFTRMT